MEDNTKKPMKGSKVNEASKKPMEKGAHKGHSATNCECETAEKHKGHEHKAWNKEWALEKETEGLDEE